jgi:hypothetical protein
MKVLKSTLAIVSAAAVLGVSGFAQAGATLDAVQKKGFVQCGVSDGLPEVPDDYVHRIGRTGRAGAAGVSISFAGEDDSYQLPSIETLLGRKISCETPPTHLLRPVERKRP